MSKLKVSAVSYLNTLPFIYGLKHSSVIKKLDLSLDIPSLCAQKLKNNEVDVGLVPTAIIPQLKEYYILSDYCIGASGEVKSVLLLSEVPLNEIEEVLLDYQSTTSVELVQILAKEYWNIAPLWTNTTEGFEDKIEGRRAAVIIGDRTFNLDKEYKYKYDLSEEWRKYSGLPFVFACWVANKQLSPELIEALNDALKFGLNNIDSVLQDYDEKLVSKGQLERYLKNDISYFLNDEKKKAIKYFLSFLSNKVESECS